LRTVVLVAALLAAAFGLSSCAVFAARQAISDATSCVKDVRTSPEGQIVYARLWANDDSDTADKLMDAKPLSQSERNALVTLHTKILRCRQIVIDHDNQYAAWETPYWEELFQKGDAIFYKLASGEIPVGLANKLTIEIFGQFQTDVSKGHADAVREEDGRRQRTAEVLLQSSAQILASQPRTQLTTTNCSWLGNNLNCSSLRH
jgi:hypothetical protein